MKAPRPEDAFHLDLNGTVIAGRYIEVDSPHRMVIEWDRQGTATVTSTPALIVITFTPTGDGTTVVEIQLSGLCTEDAAFYPQLLERYLDRIATAFAGAEPGARPGNRVRNFTPDANLGRARSTPRNPAGHEIELSRARREDLRHCRNRLVVGY